MWKTSVLFYIYDQPCSSEAAQAATLQQQWLATLCRVRLYVLHRIAARLYVTVWHQAELVSTSQPWMPGYLFHALNNSPRADMAKATGNLPVSQQKDLEQKYFISQEDIYQE